MTGARRLGEPRGDGERDGRADGAGDAVDDAPRGREHGLRPLPDLAAVAHEHGVRRCSRDRARWRGTAPPDGPCPAAASSAAHDCGPIADRRRHLARPRPGRPREPRGARDQRLGGRSRIGEGARDQARALFARDPVDEPRMWVEDDEAAGRVHERRVGEAQREVVGFAEQQDQVGPAEHLGERAQARVVDAARALHADGGHARRGREPAQQRPARDSAKHGPGQDQRPLGAGERGERRIGRGIAERAHLGRELRRARPERRGVLERLLEQIERQAQVHGPGAPRFGDVGPRGRGRGPAPAPSPRSRTPSSPAPPCRPGAAPGRRRGRARASRHVPTAARAASRPPCAVHSAPTALACPGPPVTSAMPHSPVRRAQASAMCTAAASWRTCTSFRPVPMAASNTGMM